MHGSSLCTTATALIHYFQCTTPILTQHTTPTSSGTVLQNCCPVGSTPEAEKVCLNTATFSHPSEFHPNWRTHLFKIIFSLTGLLECFWVTYKQIYSCTGLCQGPLQQWAAAAPWAQPPNPSACRIPSPTPQSWPTEQPNSYILLLLKPKQNTTLVSLYRSSH